MKVDKKGTTKTTALTERTNKTGRTIDLSFLRNMLIFQTVEVLNWVVTRVPDGWIYQPKCGRELQYQGMIFVPEIDPDSSPKRVEITNGEYPIAVTLSSR